MDGGNGMGKPLVMLVGGGVGDVGVGCDRAQRRLEDVMLCWLCSAGVQQ